MVVPDAPGIPILMPGERAGEADGPVVKYLLALQELERKCPGFAHDIHGVERSPNGTFRVECVTDTEPTWPCSWCARRAIGEPSEVGASPGQRLAAWQHCAAGPPTAGGDPMPRARAVTAGRVEPEFTIFEGT